MNTSKQALQIALNLRAAANRVDRYVIDNFITLPGLQRLELTRASFKLRQQADEALFQIAQLTLNGLEEALAAVQSETASLSAAIDKLDDFYDLTAAVTAAVGVVAALGEGKPANIMRATLELKAKVAEIK
jgi:hypothetical protein